MNKESRETMVCAGSTRDADISEGKTKRKKSLNHALLIAFFTYITLIRSLLWITPSPLMPTLMEELNLSYAQSGQLIFIVPVVMGVFLFIGSFVIDFLGPSLAITIGLAALAADGLLSSLSTSFTFLLLGHLLCGAGFGLTVGAIPALVAERFKGSSQVYVNSYNVAITPVGMALCYAIIIPMTNYFGSWKTVYFVWAAISLVGGILFYLFERKAISLHFVQRRVNKTNQTSQMRGIIGALRFKDIWWMTLAMGGSLWLYNAFSSYLPSFLSTEKNLSIEMAGSLTAMLQMAGVAGSFIWSAIGLRIKNRRLVLSIPLSLLLFASLGSTLLPAGLPLYLCIFLVGASYYAFAAMTMTQIMRIRGMKPQFIPGSIAIYMGSVSLSAIAAPYVFDSFVQSYGMQSAFLFFTLLTLPSIVGGLLIENKTNPNENNEHSSKLSEQLMDTL